MTRPIIIDTDPGIDDAVALAVALFSEALDVKLITTVHGNVSCHQVTENTLKLLRFWDKNVSVAKGCNEPLLRLGIDASDVFGDTGMDGYDFEDGNASNLLNIHAVVAMKETILESLEPMTIVPIGPLTNIAMLLKMYPEVKPKIKEIVLMGGSTSRGNRGVYSEFNIMVDPEAAKIVFSSGVKIVMVGLDVGLKAVLTPDDCEIIKGLNQTGQMLFQLFNHYRSGGIKTGLKMFDSCAIAYLLKPELFKTTDCFVDVELAGTLTTGATVCDLRGILKKEVNATVCLDLNVELFREWLIDSLKNCL